MVCCAALQVCCIIVCLFLLIYLWQDGRCLDLHFLGFCHVLQFIEDHVQMEDVRLYIKDIITEYASLQTETQIKPSWNAVCYTGQLVLDQFAFPYRLDKQVVVQAYPWLTTYGVDKCASGSELARVADSSPDSPPASNRRLK